MKYGKRTGIGDEGGNDCVGSPARTPPLPGVEFLAGFRFF